MLPFTYNNSVKGNKNKKYKGVGKYGKCKSY